MMKMSIRDGLKGVFAICMICLVGCKSSSPSGSGLKDDLASSSVIIEPQFYPIEGPSDAIFRNRKITQNYYYGGQALNQVLSRHEPGFDFQANWLHFGIWGSMRAGESMDGTDLQVVTATKDFLFDYMEQSLAWLPDGVRAPYIENLRKDRDLIKTVDKIVQQSLAGGNQRVAEEIMGATDRYIRMLGCDAVYDESRLKTFMDTFQYDLDRNAPFEAVWERLLAGIPALSKGARHSGGQDALARAYEAYHKSRFEKDPVTRAQMIYYGNLLIAIHEQFVLQTYISGAIGILDPASSIYRKAATVLAMDIGLPDSGFTGVSRPGVGLKRYPLRQSLPAKNFSKSLTRYTYPPLVELAAVTGLDVNTGRGATDWQDYRSRVYFIAGLMRTMQSNPLTASFPFSGPHASSSVQCR